MEELECITVGGLLDQLKPSPFESWYCSEAIMEQLKGLNRYTMIRVYGNYNFRLSDEYPSFYVRHIMVCE